MKCSEKAYLAFQCESFVFMTYRVQNAETLTKYWNAFDFWTRRQLLQSSIYHAKFTWKNNLFFCVYILFQKVFLDEFDVIHDLFFVYIYFFTKCLFWCAWCLHDVPPTIPFPFMFALFGSLRNWKCFVECKFVHWATSILTGDFDLPRMILTPAMTYNTFLAGKYILYIYNFLSFFNTITRNTLKMLFLARKNVFLAGKSRTPQQRLNIHVRNYAIHSPIAGIVVRVVESF